MGRRCGCVSDECSCGIVAGAGIQLSGTGSEGNPFVLEVGAGATQLVGVESSYMTVAVTGLGIAEFPYSISMSKSGLTPPAVPMRINAFLTVGTFSYAKPLGVTLLEVVCIGGGEGGQAGGYGIWTYVPGVGGCGAGWTRVRMAVASTALTGTVTVGAGGTGGIAGHGAGTGSVGQPSVMTLPAESLTVQATGGGNGQAGAGIRMGQKAKNPNNAIPTMLTPGGGAGGGGGRPDFTSGGHDAGYPAVNGGQHYKQNASQIQLRQAEDGGNGGAFGAVGAVGQNGFDGGFPGGGGGGGGQGGGSLLLGGNGGKGGDGAVWIIEY